MSKKEVVSYVRSETDLFSEPGYDMSIYSTCVNEYHPTTTMTPTTPINFYIQGNDQQYVDFSKTKLKLTCKLTDAAGNALAAEASKILEACPVNYLIASAFDQVSVHLNETEITPKSSLYPYQAYLETLLSYGSDYKKGQAEAGGFYRSEDEKATDDKGFEARKTLSASAAEFEIMGRPHGELFNQTRYLMPGVDVRISFHRASNTFCCEQRGDSAKTPILHILSAVLYVQKVSLLPSIQIAHLNTWQKTPAVYPGKRVEMKSYGLPEKTYQHTNEHLLNGLIPDRLIIGMVLTEAAQGDYKENPFRFQDFNLTQIIVTCNTEAPTQHIINVDGKFLNGFISLFDAMGLTNCDNGLDIKLKEYENGKVLFGFDLRYLSDGFSIPRHGNVSIQLRFKKPLAKPVTVIVYPEYPSTMYVNSNKQVTFKDFVREY